MTEDSLPLGKERHILVVDDEPGVLECLNLFLSAEGYRVMLASSGEAALAVLGQATFDAVVTDRNMPEMDGLKLAAHIRRQFPALPMILMSGHPMKGVDLHDFVGFLAKPFSRRQLIKALAAAW